jgi:uncharacterized protein YndB with AHSA1/START domain
MNMEQSTTDRIVKQIELKAPIARVWRAVTDYEQFNEWFKVALDAPFVPGQSTRGKVTYPGYEHMVMEVVVEKMEPERLFSFRWIPYEVGSNADFSKEITTLVEFRLESAGDGTLLTVTESGFDALPPERRDKAYRMNEQGWAEQMTNIETHVRNNS